MNITLATFNANNLFLRYRFMDKYPGSPPSKKPPAELDTRVVDPKAADDARFKFLPMYQRGMFRVFNEDQRRIEAKVLGDGDPPDIVCLQEVESMLALREFNERYLGKHYDHALVIDGRDLRQIDVGLLSTRKVLDVRTHVDDRTSDKKDYVFRRDLLEVVLDLPGQRTLTVFIAHLKSKFTGINIKDKAAETAKSDATRLREARAAAKIIRSRFPGAKFKSELFALCGDFNDEPESDPVGPLVRDLGLENVIDRLPAEERWTHWWKGRNQVGQLDYILLSPALAKLAKWPPSIERRGIGFKSTSVGGMMLPKQTNLVRRANTAPTKVAFDFLRFPTVTASTAASDHAPVRIRLAL